MQQRANFHRLQLELLTAALDARQVENIVHQRGQMAAGINDLTGIVGLLLGIGLVLGLQLDQLAKAINRIQRRAQLMAHA